MRRRAPRAAGAVVVLAGLPLAAGCGAVDPPPEPPASVLQRPERFPFGDLVASRLGTLARHVDDQVGEDHGPVGETTYVGRDVRDLEGLAGRYRRALGDDWRRVPVRLLPEEHGFGFASGDATFVVAWLDALPDGRVPAVTYRYGDARQD